MMEVEIHNDVLSSGEYKILETAIMNDEFPWYFSPHHLENTFQPHEANLCHFTHSIFDERQSSIISGGMRGDKNVLSQSNSGFVRKCFNRSESISNFIDTTYGPSQLLRCKANLYTNQGQSVHYKDHIDQSDYVNEEIIIAILSVGESNGGTVIGDTFYESNKNQLIVFDNVSHHGVSQTDSQTRICINYNFLKY
jgi:hypothetical protein